MAVVSSIGGVNQNRSDYSRKLNRRPRKRLLHWTSLKHPSTGAISVTIGAQPWTHEPQDRTRPCTCYATPARPDHATGVHRSTGSWTYTQSPRLIQSGRHGGAAQTTSEKRSDPMDRSACIWMDEQISRPYLLDRPDPHRGRPGCAWVASSSGRRRPPGDASAGGRFYCLPRRQAGRRRCRRFAGRSRCGR